MFPFLDAAKEPIFAALAIDPRFSEIANEHLRPKVYTTVHDTLCLPGLECTACIPHKISFMASSPQAQTRAKEGVVVADKRTIAKQHGPQGRGKRRGSSAH